MQVPTQAELVAAIDAFLSRHEMKPTRFGADATGDTNIVSDLRSAKRSPSLATVHRLKAFMEAKDAELAAAGEHQPNPAEAA